ncbi:hypothetical protein TNIN_153611 [Trichonephila inaurata madagascariensis]|uniref:Uncharacterized protein n=1 Tax=Trichonephila inaurata madagascariensis TaxID=2747483 RepID=A0A8X6YX69_9ARAC|nr:hypothetical protein TNIN_153611 [Trichonephila inaurata madagascariensis]
MKLDVMVFSTERKQLKGGLISINVNRKTKCKECVKPAEAHPQSQKCHPVALITLSSANKLFTTGTDLGISSIRPLG